MSPDGLGGGDKKNDEGRIRGGDTPCSHLDASIQADAWLALWEANDRKVVDIRRIEIHVRQCEVWLSGQVEDEHQMCLAECLLKALYRVKCIHNHLTINSRL
jgi:osmotically-inducible protein OsmY